LDGQVSQDTLVETERNIKQQDRDLQAKANETRSRLAADPTSLDLHEREEQWRGLSWSQTALRERLTAWTHSSVANIQVLDADEATWKATLDAIAKDLQSEHLRDVVQRSLADIRRARQKVQRQVNRIVSLQQAAVNQSLLVTKINNEIAEAERSFYARLLAP